MLRHFSSENTPIRNTQLQSGPSGSVWGPNSSPFNSIRNSSSLDRGAEMAGRRRLAKKVSVGNHDQDLLTSPSVSNFEISRTSPTAQHQAFTTSGEDVFAEKEYTSSRLHLETDQSHGFSDAGQSSLATMSEHSRNPIAQFVTLIIQSVLQWSLGSVRSIVDSYDGSVFIPRDHVRIRWRRVSIFCDSRETCLQLLEVWEATIR